MFKICAALAIVCVYVSLIGLVFQILGIGDFHKIGLGAICIAMLCGLTGFVFEVLTADKPVKNSKDVADSVIGSLYKK